jgi:hypothetical protein
MANLLEPFAVQTDILQTNAQSLSYALPALFDLECHLKSFSHCHVLTNSMLADMCVRFKSIRDPNAENFNVLPAVSCLADPSVAVVLLTPEMTTLREAATDFMVTEVRVIY